MKTHDSFRLERNRLAVLTSIMLLMLGLLAIRLWQMQMGHNRLYEVKLEQQSVRRVRIPGIRGRIFDRHGTCLADNEPNFSIAIYPEEVLQAGRRGNTTDETLKLIEQIAEITGKEPQITRSQINSHLHLKRLLPILAWQNIDETSLARLVESGSSLPAVDIMVKPARHYPWRSTACHVLGYVSYTRSNREDDEHHHFYLPAMSGRRGLEKQYDRQLSGKAGGALVRVDVSGFKYEELSRREPGVGDDIMLALDLRIQQIAERAIADTTGAVVILDPRNGDVIAMASAPGFDLRKFSRSLSQETWNELMSDSRKPLLNRAVSGMYAPGSVFKPVVAMAALEKGNVDTQQKYTCDGFLRLGNHDFRCYRRTAHGLIDFRTALTLSCNVFFYKLGLEIGYDNIREAASEMSIGHKTGIDMGYEAAGLLPSREWHYRRTGHSWRAGDTCNISIGQGSLLVTPLQMAVVAATIANGGMVYEPRLVIGQRGADEEEYKMSSPKLRRILNWPEKHIDIIKEGMKAVVHERRGTGYLALVPGVVMAAKTGTAQYGSKDKSGLHGWMILFAPFDNPRYAVAMVMDDAVTGGGCVGPRIGRMMKEIFMLEDKKKARR